jgi:hypothetical protein
MGFVRIDLPHPLFLILSETCIVKSGKDYPGIPLPTSSAEVEQDFLMLAETGVIVLLDERQVDNFRISFCTPRYEIVCGVTAKQDAFFAQRLAPLSLRTHHMISRAAVLVFPQTWGMYPDLSDLNRQVYVENGEDPAKTGLDLLKAGWKKAQESTPAARAEDGDGLEASMTPAQLTFLANVDTLIDFSCQVELEQAARQEKIPIKSVSAAVDRKGANFYQFELASLAEIRVGEYLQAGSMEMLASGQGWDGVVVESKGSSLLLRFRSPVELSQLQNAKWLGPKVSTRQYGIQHAAVNALRNQESLNPHLLPLIVDNRYVPFNPPVVKEVGERANPAQKNMIEKAQVVPDMLLALGPPGTGKTETIRAIVRSHVALGKKVLVTSKNNKAVDNVLEGLEKGRMLRIGREEVVSAEVRPNLIDNMSLLFRQRVMENIQPMQANLAGLERLWPRVQELIDSLGQSVQAWRHGRIHLDQQGANLMDWQRNAYRRVEPSLNRQLAHYQSITVRMSQAAGAAETYRRFLDFTSQYFDLPILGPFATLLAGWLAKEWQNTAQEYRLAQQDFRKSRETIRKIWESYRQYATSSEQAILFKEEILDGTQRLEDIRADIIQAKAELTLITETLPLLSGSSLGRPAMGLDSPEAIEKSLQDWQAWYELMMSRKSFLSEWRDSLQTRPEIANAALIRGADVIGATCIGIATDGRFEDLEFDLVIADEAGQIQVMDLLVPLVRARRAVLVGDHLQLPPSVDPEIIQKLRESEPENLELGGWLETSLFERLISLPTTPEANRVMLDTQYRMPAKIADFISSQFYNGRYHTAADFSPSLSPLFAGSPLVFIDTSREVRHYEQRSEDGQGYFNQLEARLVGDLFQACQTNSIDAGVIVPYKKQADVIRRELRRRQLGLTEDDLLARVATVDSFQGREQEVIIFGFTRSNAEGRIGFLTELRRLNVSLTRAKRQLILIGDSVTLTETADREFASLVKTLLSEVKKSTEGYFHANELPRRLQA